MGKHYLYKHIRNDSNIIFYIGIGTKNKSDITYNKYSRAFNKKRRNKHWLNTVSLLNDDYSIEIVCETDDYEYVKSLEKNLILFYGRKDLGLGNLVNMTDGGDGQIKRVWSEESRKKASKSHIGKVIDGEWKKNLIKARFGNKSHSGRTFSDEHRKKISEAGKGKIPWNKNRELSNDEIEKIKKGIEENKKICYICNVECDSANYNRWHGDKCEMGSILDRVDEIKDLLYNKVPLLRISRVLGIKYKLLRRLKESVLFKEELL
jgi:hypothetical protein